MGKDPEKHRREYYYHVATGDRGYLVKREGKDCIRYDRPNVELVVPYVSNNWLPDKQYRPMLRSQIVRVAFEADKQLCKVLEIHKKAKREWMDLTMEHRARWIEDGPQKPLIRKLLYACIIGELERLNK